MRIGAWARFRILREHFARASQGAAAEGARLDTVRTQGLSQDVLLESIDVEEEDS